MALKRAFISYDYDNDRFLATAIDGQARHPDTPFAIANWSIKVASPGWEAEARQRIRASDVVVVVCGVQTHNAVGVATELRIAKEVGTPYFLLKGYADKACTRPTSASPADKMYTWTWPNLKALIGGNR